MNVNDAKTIMCSVAVLLLAIMHFGFAKYTESWDPHPPLYIILWRLFAIGQEVGKRCSKAPWACTGSWVRSSPHGARVGLDLPRCPTDCSICCEVPGILRVHSILAYLRVHLYSSSCILVFCRPDEKNFLHQGTYIYIYIIYYIHMYFLFFLLFNEIQNY